MDKLMLIGQFAEIAGISRRMLRHYEKMGLIKPTSVDRDNGYRLYGMQDLPVLKTIMTLQTYGFSLGEIKAMQDNAMTVGDFLKELKEKELSIRNRMDADAGHLIKIKRTIAILNQETLPGLKQPIHLNQLDFERSPLMTDHAVRTAKAKDLVLSLPNTAYFMEKVDASVKGTPESLKAFITFDLDSFGPINEVYGFVVGDAVIYNSFKLIIESFKEMLDLHKAQACRFGGDELVIYVEGFDRDIIEASVQKALEAIRHFDYGPYGCPDPLTSSCGVYLFKTYGHNQELRHESSVAFMDVKRQGGNNFLIRNQ